MIQGYQKDDQGTFAFVVFEFRIEGKTWVDVMNDNPAIDDQYHTQKTHNNSNELFLVDLDSILIIVNDENENWTTTSECMDNRNRNIEVG